MKVEVREIKQVPPPKEYVVTLDQNELDLIVSAVGRIAGNSLWRAVVSKVYSGLYNHTILRDSRNSMLDSVGHLKVDPPVLPR